MKKIILIPVLLTMLTTLLVAQDAAVITEILNKPVTDLKDFSYMIASSEGRSGTPFEAYTFCDRYGSFPYRSAADLPLKAKTVSVFLMKHYEIKGGIFWTIFKSPRYAFRELKHTGLWINNRDPDYILSGRDVIRVLGRFYELYPEVVLQDPPGAKETAAYFNALLGSEKE